MNFCVAYVQHRFGTTVYLMVAGRHGMWFRPYQGIPTRQAAWESFKNDTRAWCRSIDRHIPGIAVEIN